MMGTIAVNIAVSLCTGMLPITVLWCINGLFQAMIWPPLTRVVSERVGVEKYADAITAVGLSAQCGTIFVYAFVPAVLVFTTWRNVFRIMSLFGMLIVALWILMSRRITAAPAEKATMPRLTQQSAVPAKKISVMALITEAGLLPVFGIIVLHGILRDGIQTWLPSLISKQFHMKASVSILSTVIMPIFSMLSVLAANAVYHGLKNELKTAALFFSVAFAAALPMAVGVQLPVVVTVVLASLVSACMHGVNHMLIAITPKHFVRYGLVSTFSGILNAFTYIGASVSTYGFAVLADNCGWNAVLMSWGIVAFLGGSLCFGRISRWQRFISPNEDPMTIKTN